MDLTFPPEILTLAKFSPWAFAALFGFRQLIPLLSPFASILAIRLARNDKERAAYLEDRRIHAPVATSPPRKLRERI